jgi:hypothetical protein
MYEGVEVVGLLAGTYVIVVCERHAGRGAAEIGTRSPDELRDLCRHFGAEPAF